MIRTDHIVFVVDDDASVRDAVAELLSSAHHEVETFGSAAEYLAFARPDLPACLVLDVELPDMSGLELQRRLDSDEHPPIVFLTGHGDVPRTVRALKAGAVDFLTKPFSDAELLGAIDAAIARDRERRHARAELSALRQRWDTLTPRERDVLPLVVRGLLNKEAAATLGISEVTLQIHRSRILHKMGAASLADLVRMAGRLGIP
ncbi:MAG TPA: response regulator [Gemmatimonadaceae bacterium]|jgi:FixJ family two-component response regulator|nr:response regulator [Gemmatimonadaceae bacterium]